MRYWTSGLYHVISLDGRHWNLNPQSQQSKQKKDFIDNMPILLKLDGPSFRIFYNELVVHACSHGFYLPPFILLRPSVTDVNGFIASDDKDRDIPQIFERHITFWSQTIAIGLKNCNPKIFGSRINNLNGYAIIVSMAKRYHPLFVQRPALLIKKRPTKALMNHSKIILTGMLIITNSLA